MRVSLVICLVVFMSASFLEAQIVTDGLVSYYTLDKNHIAGKTVKDVAGKNDGTIVGNPKSVAGHLGEALEFGGAPDCIRLPPVYEIGKKSVTYETWFKLTDRVGWRGLISNKIDYNSNFFRFNINQNAGQLRFYTEHENEANKVFITDKDYDDGEWHHGVATREKNVGKIYVDGEMVKQDVAMDGDIGGGKADWHLAQDGADNAYLIGTMDEVRIYSRALTKNEVEQNFESKISGLAVDSRSNSSVILAILLPDLTIVWRKRRISSSENVS